MGRRKEVCGLGSRGQNTTRFQLGSGQTKYKVSEQNEDIPWGKVRTYLAGALHNKIKKMGSTNKASNGGETTGKHPIN